MPAQGAMTTLLQSIAEILRPELQDNRSPITLEEPQHPEFDPVILSKSGPALVLRLDAVPARPCPRPGCGLALSTSDRLFPLFRVDTEELAASCDYVIFYQPKQDTTRLYVLLCELKQGSAGHSKRQLENSRLLIDYLIAMASYHRPVQSRPDLVYRGIVFSSRYAAPKPGTRDARCTYVPNSGRMADLMLVHTRNTRYPLDYFCA
jgi:hypothetical protein